MKAIFTIFLAILATAFLTSCTISEEGIDTTSIDADECEESGGEFCSNDGNSVALELIIGTEDPVIGKSANGDCNGNTARLPDGSKATLEEFCFDISGVCNEAGLDLASVVASTSLDNFSTSETLGSCQRGRFHVQLRKIIDAANRCKLHTLDLELVGKKADGSEVTQPAKAKKRLGFRIADSHPDCIAP